MSLSQRLQRLEGHLSRSRHQQTAASEAEMKAMWDERLPLLSDAELDRLEAIYAKVANDGDSSAHMGDGYWLHEILDEPSLSLAERDDLVALFLTMRIDLLAMAKAAAGDAQ